MDRKGGSFVQGFAMKIAEMSSYGKWLEMRSPVSRPWPYCIGAIGVRSRDKRFCI